MLLILAFLLLPISVGLKQLVFIFVLNNCISFSSKYAKWAKLLMVPGFLMQGS